jgi:2,3-bisphosphoglycerate-independent phosphoglycerate mutase
MKYAILVGDGMADFSLPDLNGCTPLEYAKTPNMDAVAKAGRVGLVKTVPDGIAPGSDVANMSLMGYDPAAYYSGRAPIEAASMGIKLKKTDVAFRCNLVTLNCGLMGDYSAGHIETSDAHEIIAALQAELGTATVKFYPGVSYQIGRAHV